MSEIPEKQLVGSVARDLVSQLAPQELPIFSIMSRLTSIILKKCAKDCQARRRFLGWILPVILL
jgi:hypothetical protein